MGLLPIFEIYAVDPEQTGNYYKRSTSPTSFDLDPYWYFRDNDFGIVTRDERSNTYDLNIKKDNVKAYVRTVGIRGPLMYSGWGYDICGLPVPSTGRNSLKFDNQTAYNRAKWKSGPVDLRWDELRKVWVGGPEIVEGLLKNDLKAPTDIDTPKKADAKIYRGFNLEVKKTVNGTDDSVTLYNRNPKLSLSSGDYFMAAKINYEWRPIGGGGGGGSSTGNNEFIMILGPYSTYKSCAGAPCAPDSTDTNACEGEEHLCGKYFAWASYKICGYKYYKVRDYTEYGAWAAELGSDASNCLGNPDLYRFYPAIFSGSKGLASSPDCGAGVRFIQYFTIGDRPCASPGSCFKGPDVFNPCDPCSGISPT
jgi:hypothetical protein